MYGAMAAACDPGPEPSPPAPRDAQPRTRGPVLVELFTSQGCSSCPPADSLLRKLADDPRVVPLAFHVDYWDYIGWRDPYGSALWSDRQRRYAQAAGTDRIYTPQLLFNGDDHYVGARKAAAHKAIADAEPGAYTLQLEATRKGDAYAVELIVIGRSGAPPRAATAFLATYQSGISTEIQRGENRGRTLRNDFIVRAVRTMCDADTGGCEAVVPELESDGGLGIAAFVQDAKTMGIHGATRIELRGNT